MDVVQKIPIRDRPYAISTGRDSATHLDGGTSGYGPTESGGQCPDVAGDRSKLGGFAANYNPIASTRRWRNHRIATGSLGGWRSCNRDGHITWVRWVGQRGNDRCRTDGEVTIPGSCKVMPVNCQRWHATGKRAGNQGLFVD